MNVSVSDPIVEAQNRTTNAYKLPRCLGWVFRTTTRANEAKRDRLARSFNFFISPVTRFLPPRPMCFFTSLYSGVSGNFGAGVRNDSKASLLVKTLRGFCECAPYAPRKMFPYICNEKRC